jgi:hypothetical protein
VTRADGGGSLLWLELMVAAAFMHVGGAPTHVSFRMISSELVQAAEMQWYLFI